MRRFFCVVPILILLSLTQPLLAADMKLVCPCSASTSATTSLELSAGIANNGTADAGNLRLRLLVHDTPAFNVGRVTTIAARPIDTVVAPGSELPITSYTAGFVAARSSGFATLVLDAQVGGRWQEQDSVRMREPAEFGTGPGAAVSGIDPNFPGAIYFRGTPTFTEEGSIATINLPEIVNSSPTVTVDNLRVLLRQSDRDDIFSQPAFELDFVDLPDVLRPLSSVPARQITLNINRQQGRYIHLVVNLGAGGSLVYDAIEKTDGEIGSRSFSLTGLDLFTDSDNDGISNFNEELAGSDPSSGGSQADASVVDLLVLYSQGVAVAHNGDALARIDHLVAVTN